MTDLIKRLEEAEEGSRELDRDISKLIDKAEWDKCANWASMPCGAPPAVIERDAVRWLPFYTTSLDAALALAERVLPGARWVMVQQPVGWGAMPLLFDGAAWNCPNDPGETVHALLPLALCIAILKATDTGRE